MQQPLNFGIVGCGVIAPCHAEGLLDQPGVKVTWACDLIAAKAERLAGRFAIPHACTDYRELLADRHVDAVCVCTDHASHAEIAVAALEAGKHVLVEKALAANRDGLAAMLAAGQRHPQACFGGVFQHRFDPEYRLLKRLLEEGALGTLLTAGVQLRCRRTDDYYRGDPWRGTWDLEGGAVCINQAIHFIDSLLWITGGAESLCGSWRNLTHQAVMETEDTAVAVLKFRNGAIGTLEATCASHLNWEPTLALHGSAGSLELRQEKLVKAEFQDAEVARQVAADYAACRGEHAHLLGKAYYGTGHLPQFADFVAAIREGRQPLVTAASAAKTVEAVLAIYESTRNQTWVNLD